MVSLSKIFKKENKTYLKEKERLFIITSSKIETYKNKIKQFPEKENYFKLKIEILKLIKKYIERAENDI